MPRLKSIIKIVLLLLPILLLVACPTQHPPKLPDENKKQAEKKLPDSTVKKEKKNKVCKKIKPYKDIFYNYNKKLTHTITNAKIIIDKEARRLFLYSDDELIKIYPISLGLDPIGDKEVQGDRRTPEGEFYVCNKNPASKYYLSLGISYPNIEDAERGLLEGLITKQEYNAIVRAIKAGRKPPWNTALGGAICIHGGGIPWDWTHGCIAMRNSDIEELFRIIPVGTPVIITRQANTNMITEWSQNYR